MTILAGRGRESRGEDNGTGSQMKKASSIVLGLTLFFLTNPPFTWAGPEGSDQSLRMGTYRIRIEGIVYGIPWHLLISTKFNKKTSFRFLSVFSTETPEGVAFKIGPHWSGVRGWVQVKKDGLHYFVRTKKDFYSRSDNFHGILGCERGSGKCLVKFSTDSP